MTTDREPRRSRRALVQKLQAQEIALRRSPEFNAPTRPRFRSLFPFAIDDVEPDDVVAEVGREIPDGRPWVVLNMIASIDGVTAVGTDTSALSHSADKAMFASLRSMSDWVLVGAGTLRAEKYQPIGLEERKQAARRQRGQADVPRLAIVTRKAEFDLASAVITGGQALIYATEGIHEMRAMQVEVVAELVRVTGEKVRALSILADLFDRGCAVLLCEGGPSLASELFNVDAVDEVHLTISPWLVGGGPAGLLSASFSRPRRFELRGVLESEGVLFGRWVRRRS